MFLYSRQSEAIHLAGLSANRRCGPYLHCERDLESLPKSLTKRKSKNAPVAGVRLARPFLATFGVGRRDGFKLAQRFPRMVDLRGGGPTLRKYVGEKQAGAGWGDTSKTQRPLALLEYPSRNCGEVLVFETFLCICAPWLPVARYLIALARINPKPRCPIS